MTSQAMPVLSPKLPAGFLSCPIAHRGLHGPGRPENAVSAAHAAVAAGYGIEVDVQLSRDGHAMVFHDAGLARMTGYAGAVSAMDAEQLGRIALKGSATGETIPTLDTLIAEIDGQVPLLVEIKHQPDDPDATGALVRAVARCLEKRADVSEWVAVMSFDPLAIAEAARRIPQVARGLTTFAWGAGSTGGFSEAELARLRAISDFDAVGAAFVSHDAADLGSAALVPLRARGVPILCWTIRSPEAEREARRLADNITFEGYLPDLPTAMAEQTG